MLNQEAMKIAAQLANGALQSGKLPVDAQSVAAYFRELYPLMAEYYDELRKPAPNAKSWDGKRLLENPDEVY